MYLASKPWRANSAEVEVVTILKNLNSRNATYYVSGETRHRHCYNHGQDAAESPRPLKGKTVLN